MPDMKEIVMGIRIEKYAGNIDIDVDSMKEGTASKRKSAI
jgi:hypothetical protein